MSLLSPPNFTQSLQALMQRVGITSFKALSSAAGVSERQILHLRRGEIEQVRVNVLRRLSEVLQISLSELVTTFSKDSEIRSQESGVRAEIDTLKAEYQRLQTQLEQQRETLREEFQQQSLQVLEPWLLQWSTAAQKAQENPQLPAMRLLPLVRPVEKLVQQWGVEAIAPVGAELPYNPQYHQLMEGTATPGDIVKVRYIGYRQGDKLLSRAKVSPILSAE